MKLTKEEVEHIAVLARLNLTEEEKTTYGGQLSDILGYVEKMQSVDTEKVEETSQVTGLTNVMREDEVIESEIHEELVACAPVNGDGYIKIPKVFEHK